MKTKVFILAALMVLVAACNENKPSQPQEAESSIQKKDLIGLWSEPYHITDMVKSLWFKDNDSLIYMDKPDTTWSIRPGWEGDTYFLTYSLTENKINISGMSIYYSSIERRDTLYFEYLTGCSIKNGELKIDSFSYNGRLFIKPLVLYKQ